MTESRDPPDSLGDIPFPDDDLPAPNHVEREPGSDDDTPMSDEAVEFFRLPHDEDIPLPEERFEDTRPISEPAAARRPVSAASHSAHPTGR